MAHFESRHHLVLEDRRVDRPSSASFDRVAFARQVLALLGGEPVTIALYSGARELRVQSGRDYARGERARWAIVGIPRDASAESIAVALAELMGAPNQPYVFDLIMDSAARSEATAAE